MGKPILYNAYCCCYDACDFDNIVCCCKGKSDCLCLTQEQCLSAGEESLGCGCVTDKNNNECCKLGCLCCTYGLKTPSNVCAFAQKTLCCVSVGSCPFDKEYIEEYVLYSGFVFYYFSRFCLWRVSFSFYSFRCACAYFFISCSPGKLVIDVYKRFLTFQSSDLLIHFCFFWYHAIILTSINYSLTLVECGCCQEAPHCSALSKPLKNHSKAPGTQAIARK